MQGYRLVYWAADISNEQIEEGRASSDTSGDTDAQNLVLVDDERVRLRKDGAERLHDAEDGRADEVPNGAEAEPAVRAGLGDEDVARELWAVRASSSQ